QGSGAVRLGLSGDHPGSLAHGLREAADQARGAADDSQGQRHQAAATGLTHMTSMTAIGIRAPGPPEVLQPIERPIPDIGPDDVLIRVAAAGVNRPDVMQRKGLYSPPAGASDIPGMEVADKDVKVGAKVGETAQGAHMCAL